MSYNDEPFNGSKNILKLDENLRKLLNSLPYHAGLIDQNFRILFANDAIVKNNLDFDSASIIGQKCHSVVFGKETPEANCPLVGSILLGDIKEREIYVNCRKMWIKESIYPTGIKTEDGRDVFLQIIRDITSKYEDQMQIKQSLSKLNQLTESSIVAITRIVEKRDGYTSGHQIKVGRISKQIALELGLDDNQARGIRIGGMLHDVGMIGISIKIISKPGKLSDTETAIMQTHSKAGYDILKDLEFDWPIADMVVQHHERLDGSGYPNKLRGDEIILGARIIAVADVFDAMTSYRPYRPGKPPQKVLEEMDRDKSKLYDKDVIEALIRLFEKGSIKVEDQ